MGLITGVLTLPLAPVRGLAWVAGQLQDEAERQLYDEERIRAELLQLELDGEDGLIDEPERTARESELLDRLAIAAARRRELMHPEPGEAGDG
ncbi:MAG TPA: gas vesicle protein GvpG [Solirubrobacteraceae bacterium]|nr:gas vesicle protein GvpG [Solirubrobacteraceae bacterium]